MVLSSWLKVDRWQRDAPKAQLYAAVPESASYPFSDGYSTRPEGSRSPRKWLWISLLALYPIGALIFSSFHFLKRPSLANWFEIYPSYIDNEPRLLIEWQADTRFSRGTRGSQAAWDDLLPPGHGHIMVHDNEIASHGLGKGKPIPGKGFAYAVSGFHQLHCLAMVREAIFRLLEKPELSLYSYGDPSNPALNLTSHLDHCFDYIRQGIMCAADSTIESKHEKAGQTAPGPEDEGWGNVRICRSWNSLKEFAGSDDRRPTDLSGLSINHYFQDGSHVAR